MTCFVLGTYSVHAETTVQVCCDQPLFMGMQQLLHGTLVVSTVLCNHMTRLEANDEAHGT